jgi:hypothetical protein
MLATTETAVVDKPCPGRRARRKRSHRRRQSRRERQRSAGRAPRHSGRGGWVQIPPLRPAPRPFRGINSRAQLSKLMHGTDHPAN